MQSSIVRIVKVVYCMNCLVIPEGKTAPEVVFHHSIDCVYYSIDGIYLLRTYLLRELWMGMAKLVWLLRTSR